MGRRSTVNTNLPPGMRVKKGARGKCWYYLDRGVQPDGTRPWEPLGSNFADALRAYASRIETVEAPPVTVPELLARWNKETATERKAATLDDIRYALKRLTEFFGDPPAPLEHVEPVHIRKYLDWRHTVAKNEKIAAGKAVVGDEGKARANREIAWFSAAWNWARDRGMTKAQNPTVGIKRHKEKGHDIYVEDEELAAIMEHADEPLREAMELAYLIGQRPGDLRDIRETDIRDGILTIDQNKTGAKLRIEVVGALAALIDRIKARKASIKGVRSLSLLCNEAGQPMQKSAMRYRFDKAREMAAEKAPNKAVAARLRSIQFRDLRAKAASDVESMQTAQKLLGHANEQMTAHYVRQRRGDKVSPVK